MRIAVTGASGYIGLALLRWLDGQGYDVVALTRHRTPISGTRANWLVRPDGRPDVADLNGCEAVVHLAGRAHTRLAIQDGVDLFDQANRELACATAAVTKAAGVPRFVQVSTLGVHGSWSAQPISEASALSGDTPYAKSKIAAERELTALLSDGGTQLTIVRPPMVYGAACPGNFPRLIKLVKSGIPLPFASIRGVRSFIHVDNLASFLAFCAITPAVQGVFVAGDGSDYELPELIRAIAAGTGTRARLLRFPPFLLRVTAKMTGRQREIDSLTRPMPVDWSKARAAGWTPAIAPASALAQVLTSPTPAV
ncbi:MAG: NAD-dependent epimerase/dehydratase family protein [Achromobacter kerstersii]|uniref:NAD-dependent epimerase/dehydratase family protein n=1 Tax=Achromobacter kerstersii TaxID=1353890 RepID=UPI003D010EC1